MVFVSVCERVCILVFIYHEREKTICVSHSLERILTLVAGRLQSVGISQLCTEHITLEIS